MYKMHEEKAVFFGKDSVFWRQCYRAGSIAWLGRESIVAAYLS